MCVVVGAGALAAGGAVAGGVISSSASKSAANASVRSADAAVAEQQRQYDQTRQDQQPWMQAGQNALNQLQNPGANFQASPDYAFRRSEGDRGIQQTAAARGGLGSGNALKALTEYNSNLASGEYGNWWNRQAGLAGVGQSATNTVGQLGAQTANNVGNALMSGGDARASGILGSANGIVGNLNNGLNTYLNYQGMNGNVNYGRAGGFGSGGYQGNSFADIYGTPR